MARYTARMKLKTATLLIALSLPLAGCGNKGPLVLPQAPVPMDEPLPAVPVDEVPAESASVDAPTTDAPATDATTLADPTLDAPAPPADASAPPPDDTPPDPAVQDGDG